MSKYQRKKRKHIESSDDDGSSTGSSSSSSDEEPGSKYIKPLKEYISDRKELVFQMFKSVKEEKIRLMSPQVLKKVDFYDLQEWFAEELTGMSKKRIMSIINGQQMAESSDTNDSDDSGPSLEIISDTEFISDGDSKIKKEGSKSKSKKKLDKKNVKQKIKVKSEKDPKVVVKEKEEKKKPGESLLDLLELEMRARAIRALIRKEDDPIPSNSKDKAPTVSTSSSLSERQANLKEQLEKIDILMKAGDDEDVLIVVPQAPTINLLSSDEESEEKKKKKLAEEKSSQAEKPPEKPKEAVEEEIRSTTPPLLPPKIAEKKDEEKKDSPKKIKKDKKEKKKKEKKNQSLSDKFDDLNKASKKVITVDSDLATKNQKLIVQIKNDKVKSTVKPKADVPAVVIPEPPAKESSPESDILDDKALDNQIIINLDDYPDEESSESALNKDDKLESPEKPKSETWASRYLQQEEVQNVIKESKIQSEIRKRLRERQRLKKVNDSLKVPEEKDTMEGGKTLGSVEEYLALKAVTSKTDEQKEIRDGEEDDSKDGSEKNPRVENEEGENSKMSVDEAEKQIDDDLLGSKEVGVVNKIDEKEAGVVSKIDEQEVGVVNKIDEKEVGVVNQGDEKEESGNLGLSEDVKITPKVDEEPTEENDSLKTLNPEKCDNLLNEKGENLNLESTDDNLNMLKLETVFESDEKLKDGEEKTVLDSKIIESSPKKEEVYVELDQKINNEVKEEFQTPDNLESEIPEEIKFASKKINVLRSPESTKMTEITPEEESVVKKLEDEVEKPNSEGIKIVVKIDNSEKSPKLTRIVTSIPKEKQTDDELKSIEPTKLITEVPEEIQATSEKSNALKSPKSFKIVESIPKDEEANVDPRSPKSSPVKIESPEKRKIAFRIDKNEKSFKMTEIAPKEERTVVKIDKKLLDEVEEQVSLHKKLEDSEEKERKNDLKLKLKIESPSKIQNPKVEKIIIKIDKKDEGEKSEYKIETPNDPMSVMQDLIIECKNLSKDAAVLEKKLSHSPESKRKNSPKKSQEAASGNMMIVESIRELDVEKSPPPKIKKVSQVQMRRIEKLEEKEQEEEPKLRKSSRIRKPRKT